MFATPPKLLLGLALWFGAAADGAEVRYNRDVLPVLASKCFACHGADAAQRKAELRLDQPGVDLEELARRVTSDDPEVMMPPPEADKRLGPEEKATLGAWIEAGAPYERHWAFQKAGKPQPPARDGWGTNNEIDRFVHARLKQSGLAPQTAAPKEQLIRRVTIDLTGLPPTLAEIDAFLADESDSAYQEVVDQLLASPRYGERMASWWLDGAHYGDSHGYDNDLENSQWPWRSWVIEAFNANMPFDQFTVEQLAGDLLPDATEDQILATAFNRNHRIQTEDGAIDEEWRTEYVIDRVETMGTVWMALALNCARCHDHKYDPIAQEEFYSLFAFFNNLDEKGFINNLRGAAEPRIRYRATEYALAARGAEEKEALDERFPLVMVMQEMAQPRQTRVLNRGQYDLPGAEVGPGLPAVLPPLPEGEEMNRLGLARWLASSEHPLTGRVVVNRLWEQLFGTGIVESTENLGVQADWPSHPQLLDWLAVDLAENGWDLKRLLKQIVTSATYRQDHTITAEKLARDPDNRLLGRGPRVRLSAEMVRDQALAVSGLLVEKLGGPSVWVYQPAGLWEEVEKRGKFVQDHGEKLYRRSLYTRIRKTVAPPSMLLFDMPSREFCSVRRARTNTPLQALALMNEVTYVEAAKKFAERMMANGASAEERIAWAFRVATARQPKPRELETLVGGYQRRLAHYQDDPKAAEQLLAQGESRVADGIDRAELAALTTVANILLNLDEILHR